MTKSNITQYDNTAANNTDVEDVPLGENLMYPSHVNNAFREMMADLADVNDGTVALTSPSATALDVTNNITVGGTVDGRDVATDGTKLDGIEASATADQTASEIKTAYESNSDTNEFSDAEQTKLAGIEAAADVTDTTNVTAAGAAMLTGATFTGSITATEATFSGNTSVKLPAGTDAQRPTGVNGMLRYNSDDDQFEGYADGAWGAIAGGGETSLLEYNYTATAGQTTFSGADDNAATLAYVAANLIVTLNGIVLENGTDYTATNGTSIVLTVAAAVDDELNVVAFKSFTTADMVPASTGGTFNGNVNVTGTVTADAVTGSSGGSVDLQYQGATKLSTTSTGLNATGNLAVSGTITSPAVPAWRLEIQGAAVNATGNYETVLTTARDAAGTDHRRFIQGDASTTTDNKKVLIGTTGVYHISANLRVDGVGSGYLLMFLLNNLSTSGDAYLIDGNPAGNYEGFAMSHTMHLTAGDEISIRIFNSSDTSWSIVGGSSFFSGHLVG